MMDYTVLVKQGGRPCLMKLTVYYCFIIVCVNSSERIQTMNRTVYIFNLHGVAIPLFRSVF